MNKVRIEADLRLSIPVLVGWSGLVVVLNVEIPLFSPSTSHFGFVAVLALSGCFTLKRLPILGLTVLTSSAVLLSWLIQLPHHVDVLPWEKTPPIEIPWWLVWAEHLRNSFLDAASTLPSFGGQLIPGLAIGDTSRVSEHLSHSMKTVSLTHITAVSGANIAIVTASVMAIGALCGVGRRVRLVIAVCALVAFVILVTPQPSVLRAAVMAVVVMISLFSGRPGSGIPLLAFATLLMLMWNPWWAIDYGFILSVSATAGLLLFSGPLASSLNRWLPLWLATVIAIPLSAQLMCQPFIILLNPQLPTYGVLANVIAAPAAPIATIIGLAGCLLTWWIPGVAFPLLWLSWLPAEWIGQTATVLSRFPESQLPWISGPVGAITAAFVSVVILLMLLSSKKRVRNTLAVSVVVTVITLTITSVMSGLRFTASIPPDWSIAACDVGQGDGLVLRSEERIAVIDVGRTPEPLRHCLEQLGITHIDLLVLTHFDKDHVGGLEAVLGKVDVAVVGKPENAEDQGLLTELARSGASLHRGTQGLTGALGEAQWQVLWPDEHHPLMDMGNPGSVTLLLTFPRFKALFLGDLGKEAQLAMMSTVHLPQVHIVKVAHHGSADQSSSLYEQIQPQIGIFSVGQENDYGHPRRETLDMLSQLGTLTPRTDQDGLILISESSTGLSVWTEH